MSHYDSKIANESGCKFINVMLQDVSTYSKYRKILLYKYPKKEGMGWPTYLLVDTISDDFTILGEIKGGMSKGDFRDRLNKIIDMS